MASRQPTVFVVDDDPAMRRSLRWLIESAHYRVQTFASGVEFLDAIRDDQPGCLVLDIQMPEINGMELQDKLQDRRIELPIIMITGFAEVSMAVQAMKRGAVDFIEKPFDDQLLLDQIAAAIERDEQRRREVADNAEARQRVANLTARERQVMEMVVRGLSNKQIALTLKLSTKTVEVHRAHVMEKMGVQSLPDLVRLALSVEAGQSSR